jgi:UDP-N-acetylmuramoylalanine--D-glutamate ligase
MQLKGKRVLVVGLGESGLAMAKWLHRQGALVRVADSRESPPNLGELARVAPAAEVIAGPFVAATFGGIDLVAGGGGGGPPPPPRFSTSPAGRLRQRPL